MRGWVVTSRAAPRTEGAECLTQESGHSHDCFDKTKARDPDWIAGLSRDAGGAGWCPGAPRSPGYQAENELPQPQPPVAVGFLKVNPDPCIELT